MTDKYTKTQQAVSAEGSALKKYQAVMVGRDGLLATLYFELCTWFAYIPGAPGLWLRKLAWPRLFLEGGRGVQFAYGVVLRHPGRIRLGSRVVVGEYCVLDARNSDTAEAIRIGDNVMLAHAVTVSAKGGHIDIGANTGLGTQTVVQSTHDCPTRIGRDCIVGPQCYLVGGGNYATDDLDTPIREQGILHDSGCELGNNVWLGGKVTVLGNVRMGDGSVAASGAVVTKNVDSNTIVGGVPARLLRRRGA